MSSPLDRELAALKVLPQEAGLAGLEAEVWRAVDHMRKARAATSVFLPVGAAAVFGALCIGVAGGGLAATAVAAPDQHEVAVFSLRSHLAPSTLLDGH